MSEPAGGFVIAVDGPAASGKGTLARRLARHYGLAHLDSGALYRAVAVRVLRSGGDPGDAADAITAAQGLEAGDLEDPALRDETTGQAASKVAAVPKVRAALLDYQHAVAATPPGAVIDGRDIGTVVCPGAALKFFLTAGLEARVARRLKELQDRGAKSIHSALEREMEERDHRDAERAVAPLKPADDAIEIDTTDLDADGVFQAALSYVEASGRAPRTG
jgi:CMP/dCMP kinase